MLSTKHSIAVTIDGNAIDFIHTGEIEIQHSESTQYEGITYRVWPGLSFIVLYLARTAKSLDTPDLHINDRLQSIQSIYHMSYLFAPLVTYSLSTTSQIHNLVL